MGAIKKKSISTYIAVLMIATATKSLAQPVDGLVKEWWFWPDYTLERNAKNVIGPRLEAPATPVEALKSKAYPFEFFGQDPTYRLENFHPSDQLPKQAFSVEMWMLYHVNQEVGVFTSHRYKHSSEDPEWLIGQHGQSILFTLKSNESPFAQVLQYQLENRGWKKYWLHIVATYDGQEMMLYVNGERVQRMPVGERQIFNAHEMQLETAAYLSKEPYMQLGDMLKCLRIYDHALPPKVTVKRQKELQRLVEEGKLYPDLFHFNAGPYLQAAAPDRMGIVWETSEPAHAMIEYGTILPLTEQMELPALRINKEVNVSEISHIQQVMLKGLKPDQPYFYHIKCTNEEGEEISSGISTFKTPAVAPAAFTFSVIGDTEARPHVNNRVAKLLWDERPEFLLNLGDLTDGGTEAHKYQWNYEYFHAVNQLTSRLPVYPVAGNGEGDLYWFNKYHILPYAGKAYYKFTHGNAEFFMLNSNLKDQFAPDGEQYEWLEQQLETSTADWKFVAHHHAPYSSDENDYGDSWTTASKMGDEAVRRIVPLYEKYGVDMVFFGHLHTYQRTHQIKENKVVQSNGVAYIQAGGAGGSLEDFAPTRSWFSAKTFRGHHYLTIEVMGDNLELRMYDSEGRMKDIYTINK